MFNLFSEGVRGCFCGVLGGVWEYFGGVLGEVFGSVWEWVLWHVERFLRGRHKEKMIIRLFNIITLLKSVLWLPYLGDLMVEA